MSCRLKRLIGIDFCHVWQDFKVGSFAIRGNGAFQACGLMTRRRISSMPAGMVIAALAVIALVALVALFLFGGLSEGGPPPTPPTPPADQSGQLPF